MNAALIICLGITFIAIGIIFCAIAMYLASPNVSKKATISKPSSIIFYIIGALTAVSGVLALIFRSIITKTALQITSLIYLVALIILLSIFTYMLKGIDKK